MPAFWPRFLRQLVPTLVLARLSRPVRTRLSRPVRTRLSRPVRTRLSRPVRTRVRGGYVVLERSWQGPGDVSRERAGARIRSYMWCLVGKSP